MNYKVEILQEMIDHLTKNIEIFSTYKSKVSQERMFELIKERRDLAALVENNGINMKGVIVDLNNYFAFAGSDTPNWSK